ncbi:hypothetical protein Dred_2796 [Desulforamulus reducens MI-1]|uniref:Uncharacterized protein n=1 Tax=Desulforamulus reducens (strain ATCC BAA-1160 / DSM 100696 / MI-1) TaxID=349161 RepID=A4J897_DESRM|nr:hypothetical protein [Desulforamulus reducens]ABO51300.1 hypothetical protein Dred_2796 [Desulforamulus reducens MI-1]
MSDFFVAWDKELQNQINDKIQTVVKDTLKKYWVNNGLYPRSIYLQDPKRYRTTQRMIYVAVSSFGPEKIFPSVKTIAEMAACSTRAVYEAFDMFEQDGLMLRFSTVKMDNQGVQDTGIKVLFRPEDPFNISNPDPKHIAFIKNAVVKSLECKKEVKDFDTVLLTKNSAHLLKFLGITIDSEWLSETVINKPIRKQQQINKQDTASEGIGGTAVGAVGGSEPDAVWCTEPSSLGGTAPGAHKHIPNIKHKPNIKITTTDSESERLVKTSEQENVVVDLDKEEITNEELEDAPVFDLPEELYSQSLWRNLPQRKHQEQKQKAAVQSEQKEIPLDSELEDIYKYIAMNFGVEVNQKFIKKLALKHWHKGGLEHFLNTVLAVIQYAENKDIKFEAVLTKALEEGWQPNKRVRSKHPLMSNDRANQANQRKQALMRTMYS